MATDQKDEHIDLRGRGLTVAEQLSPARVLLLDGNKLTQLDLGKQDRLVRLGATNNLLKDLQLPLSPQALRTIDVSFNYLNGLGKFVLPNLKIFLAAHNCFETLDFLHLLPRAITLDLSHNQIRRVVGCVIPLRLQNLHLGNNILKDLDWLNSGTFPVLRDLNLSCNALHRAIFPALPALLSLDISNNQFKRLCGLERLSALEVLCAQNNLIEEVEEFGALESVECLLELRISGNPCAHANVHETLLELVPTLTLIDDFELVLSVSDDEELIQLQEISSSRLEPETLAGMRFELENSIKKFERRLVEEDLRLSAESAEMEKLICSLAIDPPLREKGTAVIRAQKFLDSLKIQQFQTVSSVTSEKTCTPAFKIKSLKRILGPAKPLSIAALRQESEMLKTALSSTQRLINFRSSKA